MKKKESLHDLAVRLCEGGVVWFDGLSLKAVEVPDGFIPCRECEMDCACSTAMQELCAECEMYTHKGYYLEFAYKQ